MTGKFQVIVIFFLGGGGEGAQHVKPWECSSLKHILKNIHFALCSRIIHEKKNDRAGNAIKIDANCWITTGFSTPTVPVRDLGRKVLKENPVKPGKPQKSTRNEVRTRSNNEARKKTYLPVNISQVWIQLPHSNAEEEVFLLFFFSVTGRARLKRSQPLPTFSPFLFADGHEARRRVFFFFSFFFLFRRTNFFCTFTTSWQMRLITKFVKIRSEIPWPFRSNDKKTALSVADAFCYWNHTRDIPRRVFFSFLGSSDGWISFAPSRNHDRCVWLQSSWKLGSKFRGHFGRMTKKLPFLLPTPSVIETTHGTCEWIRVNWLENWSNQQNCHFIERCSIQEQRWVHVVWWVQFSWRGFLRPASIVFLSADWNNWRPSAAPPPLNYCIGCQKNYSFPTNFCSHNRVQFIMRDSLLFF